MRKIRRTMIASLLVSAMVITPVFAEPSISDLEKSKKAAENEVSSLQSELQGLLEKINSLEVQLIETGQEIEQAGIDLQAAEERSEQQYEDMKLRIKYMYENGETSALETLFSSTDFSDLLNKAEYVQNVHKYDRDKLDEYLETQQEIADLKAQLEEDMANLQTMQAEYAEQEANLNQTIEAKRDEVADLDAQLQAAVEEAARKQREEEERKAEEARKAAEAAERAQANRNNSGSSTSNSGGSSSSGGSSNSGNSYSPAPVAPSGGGSSYGGSGDASVGSAILSAASGYLGVPYVWGGTSGSGVDCSGLVYLAHRAVGISVARQSGSLGAGGRMVSASEAMPGDVVCYSGHVGIYAGGGQMIHAPQPGQVVCYTSVNYASHWFRRYW